MNFTELVDEVYDITNRPDLTTLTQSSVRAATLKAHTSDFYSKDIYETGVEFTESKFIQSLDYVSLFSNWRALKYFKRVTDENDTLGKEFTILSPEELVDSYGASKTDVGYVAGRVLELRSSVAFDKALLGCYVYPIVREGAYTSWIAEQFPYAIVYEAARKIFKSIGQPEESNAQRELVAEEYTLLKQTALTDVGY